MYVLNTLVFLHGFFGINFNFMMAKQLSPLVLRTPWIVKYNDCQLITDSLPFKNYKLI